MIVVDASALMAILLSEPDHEPMAQAIAHADRVAIAAPTKLELGMVAAGRLREAGVPAVRALLDAQQIDIIDWTDQHAEFALEAFLRFGKGRHPAGLNFGDCMAYAMARSLDAPLLYKGGDFARTDIRSAL